MFPLALSLPISHPYHSSAYLKEESVTKTIQQSKREKQARKMGFQKSFPIQFPLLGLLPPNQFKSLNRPLLLDLNQARKSLFMHFIHYCYFVPALPLHSRGSRHLFGI